MQYGLAQVVNSGSGPFVDMKLSKKAEVIAWGGYKGRLKTALIDASGTTTINGVEVFKDVPLMGKIDNKDTPASKVLELLGMGEDDRKQIIKAYAKDVKSVTLNWDATPKPSGNRLDQELRTIRDAISKYDKIVVSQGWRQVSAANKNTANRGYTWQQGVKGTTPDRSLDSDGIYRPAPTPDQDNFLYDRTRLMHRYAIRLVKKDGTVEKPDIQLSEALTSLILLSGQKAFKLLSNRERFDPTSNGRFKIVTVEEYTTKLDVTAIAQDIDMYARKTKNGHDITEQANVGLDDFSWHPIPIYGYHVWVSEQLDHQSGGSWIKPTPPQGSTDVSVTTNGLFIQHNGKRYLTVQGLAQCQPQQFVWVSSFADISFRAKKGGFLKRFFGGLMGAIMSLINTIVEVIFKVPVLAYMFSTILGVLVTAGKIMGGDAEVWAKSIFKSILTAAMLYYAPGVFGFEVGAIGGMSIAGVELGSLSGMMSLVSIGTSAVGNYNQYQWESEQKQYEWEDDQDPDTFADIKEVDIAGHNDPSMWEKMYYVQYTGMFDTEFIFNYQNTDRIPEYGRPQV